MKRSMLVIIIILVVLIIIMFTQTLKAPMPPRTIPFGDNQYWIVDNDMKYSIGKTKIEIVVPRGFVTDFASIPQSLWSLGLSSHGQYSRAAVIHDYLYWTQGCTREQADRLLVIAMKESGVSSFDEWAIYQGVNKFGEKAWQGNRQERAARLPRIIPKKKIEEYLNGEGVDPNINWPAYRKILIEEGVKDPEFIFDPYPKYCKYGDSMNVP